jgi:hypothetical protein
MTLIECKWCGREGEVGEDVCDCEERRTCDKAGQPRHRMCGALPCGCPVFGVVCGGECAE